MLQSMGSQRIGLDWATEEQHGYISVMILRDKGHQVIYRQNSHNSKKTLLVTQLCPTLCDPMEHSPPGYSVRGILQARILEWVAIPFFRGSSQLRDRTRISCVTGRFLTA